MVRDIRPPKKRPSHVRSRRATLPKRPRYEPACDLRQVALLKPLVTGGAGYVGSVVANRLVEAGRETVVLDNLSNGHQRAVSAGARFVRGDLLDAPRLRSDLFAPYPYDPRPALFATDEDRPLLVPSGRGG